MTLAILTFEKVSSEFCIERLEKSFEEKIVRYNFVFSLIDVHLEKIVYDLLPFKLFCYYVCRMKGSKNVGKCYVCSRFFVDDSDIALKIDQRFLFTENSLQHLSICEPMEQVNARSVVLNLYYLVEEYAGNGKMTENFREMFFETANNPFGV